MHLHLTFRDDGNGWQVSGLPRKPGYRFADLNDALDHAKRQCAGKPAAIELFVEGRYICTAFQEQGWPRRLCRLSLDNRHIRNCRPIHCAARSRGP
jgi:hypothetical protein